MSLISIAAAKSLHSVLSRFGRGGSLPGSVALKLDPDSLQHLKIDAPVILVTGTNGKTTTSNLISAALEEAGNRVVSNRKGDNMKAGIASVLLQNASLTQKVNADYIVLEVDELNVRHVLPALNVKALVVTNFFRDQLDRAKEMEVLIQSIESVLTDYEGLLVLNGNDPNTVRIKNSAPKARALYFGVEKSPEALSHTLEASEGKFCPNCSHPLEYDYYQYSHIGRFHCPACSFESPVLDVELKIEDLHAQKYRHKEDIFQGPYEGLYSLYNYAALHALMDELKVQSSAISSMFNKAPQPAGRNETFQTENQRLVLNLVKNPTGTNEVLKVIEADPEEKAVIVVLNDREQDGTDVSWIYDAVFERILNEKTKKIVTTGLRKDDMALRLFYGGYENLSTAENLEEALQQLKDFKNVYVIATYTALFPSRKTLLNYAGQQE